MLLIAQPITSPSDVGTRPASRSGSVPCPA